MTGLTYEFAHECNTPPVELESSGILLLLVGFMNQRHMRCLVGAANLTSYKKRIQQRHQVDLRDMSPNSAQHVLPRHLHRYRRYATSKIV